MISPQIDDLGLVALHELDDLADHPAVARAPFPAAAQRPAVDDVTIEHELAKAEVF